MAKIGTAHVEIKPVLNREALDAILENVEIEIAAAVRRGLSRGAASAGAPDSFVVVDASGDLIGKMREIAKSGRPTCGPFS